MPRLPGLRAGPSRHRKSAYVEKVLSGFILLQLCVPLDSVCSLAFSGDVPAGLSGSLGWGDTAENKVLILSAVEDTLVSSGGVQVGGEYLDGTDSRLRHSETYPGIHSLLYLLSKGPNPAGRQPRSSLRRPMGKTCFTLPKPVLFSRSAVRAADFQQSPEESAGSSGEATGQEVEQALLQNLINAELADAAKKVTRDGHATWKLGSWFPSRAPEWQRLNGLSEKEQKAAHIWTIVKGSTQALAPGSATISFFSASDPTGTISAVAAAMFEKTRAVFLHVPQYLSMDAAGEEASVLPSEAHEFSLNTAIAGSSTAVTPAVALTFDVVAHEVIPAGITAHSVAQSLGSLSSENAAKVASAVENLVALILQRFRGRGTFPVIFVRFRKVEIHTETEPSLAEKHGIIKGKERPSTETKSGVRVTLVPYADDHNECGRFIPLLPYQTTISAAAQAHVVRLLGAADFGEIFLTAVKDLRSKGPFYQPANMRYIQDMRLDWLLYGLFAKLPGLILDKQLGESSAILLHKHNPEGDRARCVRTYVLPLADSDPFYEFTKMFCYNFPEVLYPSSAGSGEFALNALFAGAALAEVFTEEDRGTSADSQAYDSDREAAGNGTDGPAGGDGEAPTPRMLSAGEEDISADSMAPHSEDGPEVDVDGMYSKEKGNSKEGARLPDGVSSSAERPQTSLVPSEEPSKAKEESGALPAGDGLTPVTAEEAVDRPSSSEEKQPSVQVQRTAPILELLPKKFVEAMQERFGRRWVSFTRVVSSTSILKDYIQIASFMVSQAEEGIVVLPDRRIVLRRSPVSAELSAALRHHLSLRLNGDISGDLADPLLYAYNQGKAAWVKAVRGLLRFKSLVGTKSLS
ncbi:transmembrane protein [Cystoisospora suis]|uniref:Transmembrane protein n=1 Tax=Cystoisospora suis TaxID=483139 RepID=A0A2C6KY12_9APIC|nr:transmembrane protein [Cystoisospora suis]